MGQGPYQTPHPKDIEMANNHMNRCSLSYVIREMQIKKTIRYHHIPMRMAKIWNTDKTTNAGKDVEQEKLSHIAGGNAKWYSQLGRQFRRFSQNHTYSFYHTTQHSSSLVFTQGSSKLMSTQKPTHGCL